MSKQKELGQYMTPLHIAIDMAKKFTSLTHSVVLDPACGDGNLLLAAAMQMAEAGCTNIGERLIGIDIDPEMIERTKQKLNMFIPGLGEEATLFVADFLDGTCATLPKAEKICIISNPPYGNGREKKFFDTCLQEFPAGQEMVFLMPLAFVERVNGLAYTVLSGRPLGVTTGHAIIVSKSGEKYSTRPIKGLQRNKRGFSVYNGIKIYEEGSGTPAQTRETVETKPYSSEHYVDSWLPCLRTGDIKQNHYQTGRLFVDYGPHLAQPKSLDIFKSPKVFVRRMPEYGVSGLSAVYCTELVLCAGDILVITHPSNDPLLLRGLTRFLNSPEAAQHIYDIRPTVLHRASYPKIAGKDLNYLFENWLPNDDILKQLGENT